METERVRTIFQPDTDKEMPADEAGLLRAQGLLHEPEPQPAAAPPPARASVTAPAAPTPMPKGTGDGGK